MPQPEKGPPKVDFSSYSDGSAFFPALALLLTFGPLIWLWLNG
jgi:hypothetical protein